MFTNHISTKKITNKEIAAKKIFLIFLNKSVIIGPILIQL